MSTYWVESRIPKDWVYTPVLDYYSNVTACHCLNERIKPRKKEKTQKENKKFSFSIISPKLSSYSFRKGLVKTRQNKKKKRDKKRKNEIKTKQRERDFVFKSLKHTMRFKSIKLLGYVTNTVTTTMTN